jgi:hypothetical protein
LPDSISAFARQTEEPRVARYNHGAAFCAAPFGLLDGSIQKERGIMKAKRYVLMTVTTVAMLLVGPVGMRAQHTHPAGPPPAAGHEHDAHMDMSKMMQAPHHVLMMTYMKGMSLFATSLRDQAARQEPLDAEFARAAVAELRHDFDAAESIHKRHMESMGTEMPPEKQKMMKEMGAHHSMVKDKVSALEEDVKIDKPDAAKVNADARALLAHLDMMSKMKM